MEHGKILITTSWDDGHPLDLRLADLLMKYNIKATFYVPRTSERGTISEREIRNLGQAFEIGGHTMSHVYLDTVGPEEARREIVECRAWVESVTGRECATFCFPAGRFTTTHLDAVRDAGYLSARTVELFSMAPPSRKNGVLLMPTTVQAQPHSAYVYGRNLIKRRSLGSLWTYLVHGRGREWPELARWVYQAASRNGGIVHIWGHSWEIDEFDQWGQLEDFFRFLSDHVSPDCFRTNGDIARQTALPERMAVMAPAW